MFYKKLLISAAVVIAVISICGCFTPPGKIDFDPTMPREETAYIVFGSSVVAKEYNGINVLESWYPRDKIRVNRITIPAGESTFLINIRAVFRRGNTDYHLRIDDLQLKHNFEAGKEYTVGLYAEKNTGTFLIPRQKVILAIWDKAFSGGNPGNTQNDSIIRSWEISEY